MDNDDELGLAPMEDEDLRLVPVDDAAEKQLAEEFSYKDAEKAGIRLIPVVCTACNTRLYAGENQVGLWKRCPVCERLNEIFPVDPKFMLQADDPEAEGGYDVAEPEISKRERFRLAADYRKLSGESEFASETESYLEPITGRQKPLMDRMLDHVLKSKEEKIEEDRAARREAKIEAEFQGIRKAVREGKLEEHLALKEKGSNDPSKGLPSDPAERKRAERQRAFDIALSDPFQNRSDSSSMQSSTKPPPLPAGVSSIQADAVFAALDAAIETVKTGKHDKSENDSKSKTTDRSSQDFQPSASLWAPLFDSRCRNRMLILTVVGLVGNLFGEKARSMIWQVLIDRVYGQTPGYSYNFQENVLLLSSFWIGGVLTIVWLSLLFLFGISLFQATARGNDQVRDWIPFDLDFGFSYIGWTLLIIYLASVPGQLLWFLTDTSAPQFAGWILAMQPLLLFLFFPVLFLCVIESDTFFGAFPRKTLDSLRRRPMLWLKFYGEAFVFLGLPLGVLLGFAMLGLAFDTHRIMQSALYYLVAAFLLTATGFAVLLYFRLLGKLMHQIRRND